MSQAIRLQYKDTEAVSFYISVLETFQVGATVIQYCGKGQSLHNPISGVFVTTV